MSSGQARAFINVDALFLESDLVELLPKDIVVFEIDVAAFADESLLPRCQDLKAKGYAFSISGVTDVTEQLWPLVRLATWLKVNIDSLPLDRLQTSARALGTTSRTLIAAHVESQSHMELCRLLGFHLFQGYYFAKPTMVEGRKLDASTNGLVRLIKLVAEEADEARLDAAFSQGTRTADQSAAADQFGRCWRARAHYFRCTMPSQRWDVANCFAGCNCCC
ncbi:MAG: EAL domain-containing protein [Sulfuritalea sp.]|nr:EAL domain-containing protein [Sulfuritalea sp.]